MPTTEVTLVLSDWTKGNNGKKFELPHIQMTSPIVEVKKSVIQALDASDLKPESILLFIGSLVLRDDKLLKDYNKSGRSKLSVDVYERVDLNLKVKTLQSECFLLCVGFGPAPLTVGVGSQASLYACLCSLEETNSTQLVLCVCRLWSGSVRLHSDLVFPLSPDNKCDHRLP